MAGRKWGRCLALWIALAPLGAPANAYLFWARPDFSGPPVRGDEPGIALPLPGAAPDEIRANLTWTLRAALNVAALQCQFSPPLMVVDNYNTILSQHAAELGAAYQTLGAYFRRTAGKGWQRALDSYTTQSYNGLSTFHAQIGFCETAAAIGRVALSAPRTGFAAVAEAHMREIRNSLVPQGDPLLLARQPLSLAPTPSFEARCWKKGKLRKQCQPVQS